MKYKLSEILSLSLDVGEAMIKSGAEISRVEDTVRRICAGYNVKYIEVYAINSLLIATLRDDKTSVEGIVILFKETLFPLSIFFI